MGKYLKIKQNGSDLVFYNTNEAEFKNIWQGYFDLARDYNEILNRAKENELLLKITENCGGIRLLRQDPWEALCSFIISQNNNIPRIKKCIECIVKFFFC